ncbi:hypothetical protein [Chryseobacterium sp. ERMR1:04]|uniref:hypothetical protein n=1 Tax=Chryseobacterium sp. ERMR1:04 TaxID=1705393 RepID=UPI000F5037CD|nr:hypothetical protein [Chryseobacterium sp. ERMR1:04]
MIRKVFILIFIISTVLISAQREVLDQYPHGQYFYAGGINEFNKEVVKVVKQQKLLPCENVGEKYTIPIIVNENSTINYIKDFDTITIQKNKCAFDFARKIMPHLKRWIPAKENDKYIASITKIEIKPFYLYYSKDDPRSNEMKNPVYEKGMKSFASEIIFIFNKKVKKNEDKYASLTFVVNEKGEMEGFEIEGNYTENEKKDIVDELSRIKGKWKPASFNGIPLKFKLRQPLRQNFDVQIENEENMKSMNQMMYNR